MFQAFLNRNAPQFVGRGIGLAVGIIHKGETITYGFGETHDGNSTVPHSHKIYEIGSITKTFTTTLLAALVVEEVVNLHQPVCDLLPELPAFPPSITLLSLATHTSGLPRLPDNIWKSVRQNRQNPYVNYSEADLLDYLRTVKTSDLQETGGLIRYSNLGMGVLGYALSKHLRVSYGEAIQHWICRPLALHNTSISLSSEQEQRLAQAHNGAGKSTSNFDMPSLPGAGALRSNTEDLLRFLCAHLTPAQPLRKAVQLTLQVRNSEFAREPSILRLIAQFRKLFPRRARPALQTLGIGLGWMRGRLPKSGAGTWWHNGGTTGYRSFAAFVPESQTGVIVLNNRGISRLEIVLPRYTVDDLGIELLDDLNLRRGQDY